jgi:hypothetical protein
MISVATVFESASCRISPRAWAPLTIFSKRVNQDRSAFTTRARSTAFPSSASTAVFRTGHPPAIGERLWMKLAMSCFSFSTLLAFSST